MLKEVKLTPEQAQKAADFFNRIHAEARESAAKDPNHPYNAYLWAINGGLDAALIGTDPDLQVHLRAIGNAYQEHLQSKLPASEP
jgi:hypothetical protein